MALDFDMEGMKELQILAEGMNYPVAIPIYTDWQKTQYQYLIARVRNTGFSSYDVCRWCITHQLQFKILYPMDKKTIFKHPYKFLKYLEMMSKLKSFSSKK